MGCTEVKGIDPVEQLAQLFDYAAWNKPPGPVMWDWLVVGILRAIRRGESLDEALGLSAAGRRSLQRRLLLTLRDEQLVRALSAVAVDPQVGDWERCLRLAPLVKDFVREWPKLRRLTEPPGDGPEWRHALFSAAQCDQGLPTTPRGLLAALKRYRAYSLNDSKVTMLARYL